MQNEILLIVSLIITYSVVLILFALFRRRGLYLWSVIATIAANIEVLIVVNAFGMEMTLGNILFASTFLVTDILSELYDKKAAQTAVWLGIATSVCFIFSCLTSGHTINGGHLPAAGFRIPINSFGLETMALP